MMRFVCVYSVQGLTFIVYSTGHYIKVELSWQAGFIAFGPTMDPDMAIVVFLLRVAEASEGGRFLKLPPLVIDPIPVDIT